MDAKGEQTAFVYTTYIQETPGRVWQGLTDPALMKRYWRHQTAGPKTFRSDWKKGSTYEMAHDDVGLAVRGPGQVILEADPPRRLAYTWHTITPEWPGAPKPAPRSPSTSKTSATVSSSPPSPTTASRLAAQCCRTSPRDGPPSWPASRRDRPRAPRERPRQTTAQVPRPEPRPRQTPASTRPAPPAPGRDATEGAARGRLSVCPGSRPRLAPPERHSASAGWATLRQPA
jgi:uncharacterized protein YndB with AHSA1/START domain